MVRPRSKYLQPLSEAIESHLFQWLPQHEEMHDASKYQLDTEPSILRFTLQYWRKPKEKTNTGYV